MKIKLTKQSIRFRIDLSELEDLLKRGELRQKLYLSESATLTYWIKCVERSKPMRLFASPKKWLLEISTEALDSYKKTLPNKQGLIYKQPVLAGKESLYINVIFEVDVKK